MDKEINTLKERLKNERHAFDAKTNKMADQIDELRTEVLWNVTVATVTMVTTVIVTMVLINVILI